MSESSCERCGEPLTDVRADCPACAEAGRAAGDPLLGRLFDGRYRLLRKIGTGGMGSVHLARHVLLGVDVAVKSLRADRSSDPIQRGRFLREARIMNRIRHPNIVEVSDFGELEDGLLYLVMEYVEGTTLHARLREGPLEVGSALEVAEQVADALIAAHAHGVIHRDLKPENVLLAGGPDDVRVKLLDFGIAALVDAPSITGTQQLVGTPGYMAPEYVRTGLADGRSDLYSLGVLLYEMLSCRLPFEARSYGALLLRQSADPPVPLRDRAPDLDPRVESLVMHSIERKPDDRFADVEAMRDAIRDVASGLGIALRYAAPRPSRPPERGTRTTDPDPITTTPLGPPRSEFPAGAGPEVPKKTEVPS